MLDELLPLAAERAGGVAWEYYFSFGGGRPPWVSGLAQGTAVQALARAATRLDREADVLPVAKRALAIFEAPTPQGVRVPAEHGDHYAIYSFAPNLRVLNGFIQALIGLYDYARIGADPRGTALFQAAEPEARAEVPAYDTGAWSLYSRGSSTHESTLSYHDLLQGFLKNLCTRTKTDVYCATAERFVQYKSVPPVVAVQPRTLRGGRKGRVRFTLSKISNVDLRIRRAGKLVEARPFGAVGYGKRTFGWDVPRRRGDLHGAAERPRPRRQPGRRHRHRQGAEAQAQEATLVLPGLQWRPASFSTRARAAWARRRSQPPPPAGARRPAPARSCSRPTRRTRSPSRCRHPSAPSRSRWRAACGRSRCRRRRRSSATGRPRRSGWAACSPSAAWSGSPPRS